MWNIKKACIILLLWLAYSIGYAQTVTNVRFEQVNKQVKITYNLEKQADITVSVSEDGGTTWHAPLKQVSGDVGKQVQPGSKTIYWDVLAEYDQLVGTNICFKITPEGGENLTFTINGVSFTMVYVQGGTFSMGATSEQGEDAGDEEKPAHKVTLSDYYIGQFEVTQGLWQAVMGSNPAYHKNGDCYPIETILWVDCQQFIRKLNGSLSGQLDGKHFVLPTEAQWEYAARGGQKSKGYKYAGSNNLTEVGWYSDNSEKETHPVGQKLPNELGLYDMSGNVEEWCQDWYLFYYSSAQTYPRGISFLPRRVYRGGCYYNFTKGCRVSFRSGSDPAISAEYRGLRLALIP